MKNNHHRAFTIMHQPATWPSTQTMPLGWKITVVCQMANLPDGLVIWPWRIRSAGTGRDIGKADGSLLYPVLLNFYNFDSIFPDSHRY